MTFDDAWVDEVSRGFKACKVFLWYPLYCTSPSFPITKLNEANPADLAYNQMLNNLTSQAANNAPRRRPQRHHQQPQPFLPNHLHPIMDRIFYPFLRRIGIQFTPLKRITAGFLVAACFMVAAAVTQLYIYRRNPCGNAANQCLNEYGLHADISVWVQAVAYVLGAISEIFANITSLEYAFMKAPKNMRSLVQAVALFMNAFSSALAPAFVGLSEDPLLVWNYGVVAILAAVGGVGFWLVNWKLDRDDCVG